jgi:Fic family protein
MNGLLLNRGGWLTWFIILKDATMDDLKDNIKIVDGDKKTLRRAKFRILKQKLQRFAADLKWRILVILNGFKF